MKSDEEAEAPRQPPPPKTFKHPSRRVVVITHVVQVILSIAALIMTCIQMAVLFSVLPNGDNTPSFLTISAFASLTIAVHAAIAIVQLRLHCTSAWLFLILHNVIIMTLGLGAIVTTLWAWYENAILWLLIMICVAACILLSIPSTIRAARLRKQAKRALKLAADEQQDEICRKSLAMDHEPKPYTQSVKSQQSTPEIRISNSHKTPSRPISTVTSTAETTANWSNGTGSATLDPFGDRASETHSLPSYGSRLSKDMNDEINRVI